MTKRVIHEIDFVNRYYIDRTDTQSRVNSFDVVETEDGSTQTSNISMSLNNVRFTDAFAERFLTEIVDQYWHDPGKDELMTVLIYDDDSVITNRRRLKINFDDGTRYWAQYRFTEATQEQVNELRDQLVIAMEAFKISSSLNIYGKSEKISEEYLFFDQRYNKRVLEKNNLLQQSDWRVLPDVVDSYPGEKDMWIKWRTELRGLILKSPLDYEDDALEFLRHLYNLRWPIDPKKYWSLYPEGLDADGNTVEYLKEGDETQWVEREVEASDSFVESRLLNIMEMRNKFVTSGKRVTAAVKEMMQTLRLEDFVENGIDYTKLYTPEELYDIHDPDTI